MGASEFVLPGTAPAEALHTFTLDSGASRNFFRDSTTLTPLPAPVPVRLADPSGGPVIARSSTVLPCPAVPSGSLSSLHLPSFSTNLMSTTALQGAMVTTTTPGGQRVSICTCTWTGRHLATFTRRPGSSLYTLATEPPQVAASAQVSTSGQVAPPCSCRLLSHQTLLWHHRLGHPSLPRLRGMHSRLLVSGLPRSLPPLPPSPAPPCLPCVEGQQRAAPHSSFPPTTAPLQTLHMDSVSSSASISVRTFLSCACTLAEVVSSLQTSCGTFVVGRAFSKHHPRVSLPETSPTLRWTGKVGDASVFRGPARSSVSQVDPLSGTAPVEVAVGSGAARGVVSGGAASGGAEPGVAESEGGGSGGAEPWGEELGGAEPAGVVPKGAQPEGVETRGAESEGAESGGAEPQGAALSGGPAGASLRLSPQQLCEWLVHRACLWSGAPGVGGAGATRAGGIGVTSGAGGTGGTTATGPGGARTRGTGAAGSCGVGGAEAGDPTEPGLAGAVGSGTGGPGAGGAGVGDTCAGGAGAGGTPAGGAGVGGTGAGGDGAGGAGAVHPGGTVWPRPYFVPLLQQVLGVSSSTSLTPPLLCPPPDQSQQPLQPASPLPAPSPYTEQSSGLTEHREPASRPVLPVCTARRVPRSRPPPVPGMHAMALRPSSVPLHYVAASALVAELLDFAAACRLDYAAALVDESASAIPPSVEGECALGTDVFEDRQEEFECLAADVPRFASMLLAPEGDPHAPDIPTPRSYAEAITGLHSGLGFAPSTADPSLFLRTDTSLPPLYVLVYVDDLIFATADTEAQTLVKSELQKRHTCTDLGELHSYLGLQITRDRARRTITLTQSHMVHQVLQHFGFQFSSPQPTPLSTGHSLSAPPSDESVEPSGPYPELVGCLMYLMTCTRPDLAYPLSLLARYVAPGRH
ncbi:unnamed protein product [Closterium sp. NIES-54]